MTSPAAPTFPTQPQDAGVPAPPHDQFELPHGALGRAAGRIMAVENRRHNQAVVERLNLMPGERVLELGCGPGIALAEVARFSGVFACGLDASREMVRQARRHVGHLRLPAGRLPPTVVRARVQEIPFPDGAFQAAFGVRTLASWDDPHDALGEVHRVLGAGGRLLLAEKCAADPTWWTPRSEEVADLLRAAGFSCVDIGFGPERRPLMLAWGWKT